MNIFIEEISIHQLESIEIPRIGPTTRITESYHHI